MVEHSLGKVNSEGNEMRLAFTECNDIVEL